jgi:hypothetical protein
MMIRRGSRPHVLSFDDDGVNHILTSAAVSVSLPDGAARTKAIIAGSRTTR